MELASIIVPIYNAEKYLDDCIKSLTEQTYKMLQIILVDDGSTDESRNIYEKYSQSFDNIEIHYQSNQGVSAARNLGLQYAKGKYIFFVDADDYILPEYIEHFMSYEECEFIGGGYCENPIDGWKLQFENLEIRVSDYATNSKEYFSKVPSVHVTGNRYMRKIIEDNSLKFDITKTCGEDIKFNVDYMCCIDKVKVIDTCEYVYRCHAEQTVLKFFENRLEQEREECVAREKLFGDSAHFDEIRWIHWYTALEHYYKEMQKKNENYRIAKRKLRETMNDGYFRKCMKYIWKNGTLDMKIAKICINIKSYILYKAILIIIKLGK